MLSPPKKTTVEEVLGSDNKLQVSLKDEGGTSYIVEPNKSYVNSITFLTQMFELRDQKIKKFQMLPS